MDERATKLIREKLIRNVMIKWIEQDKECFEGFPSGKMWYNAFLVPLKIRLTKELAEIKRELYSNAIFIIEEEWNTIDIKVKYKEKGLVYDCPYMMPMLNADAHGRIEAIMEGK